MSGAGAPDLGLTRTYKLQWIDGDGFHRVTSKDKAALVQCALALRHYGASAPSAAQVEVWDITDATPQRLM